MKERVYRVFDSFLDGLMVLNMGALIIANVAVYVFLVWIAGLWVKDKLTDRPRPYVSASDGWCGPGIRPTNVRQMGSGSYAYECIPDPIEFAPTCKE